MRTLNEQLGQSNERLHELMSQLAASNMQLEAFSYSVAHDLRAPLRAVSGYCNLLQDEYGIQLDVKASNHVLRMQTSARQMGRMIEGLLELSRLTREEVRRERVDLSQLAQGIAHELQRTAPERAVAFDIQPGLTVNGDPRLVRVLLTNLLGNAWKYSRTNPHARIELGSVSMDHGVAFFCAR